MSSESKVGKDGLVGLVGLGGLLLGKRFKEAVWKMNRRINECGGMEKRGRKKKNTYDTKTENTNFGKYPNYILILSS